MSLSGKTFTINMSKAFADKDMLKTIGIKNEIKTYLRRRRDETWMDSLMRSRDFIVEAISALPDNWVISEIAVTEDDETDPGFDPGHFLPHRFPFTSSLLMIADAMAIPGTRNFIGLVAHERFGNEIEITQRLRFLVDAMADKSRNSGISWLRSNDRVVLKALPHAIHYQEHPIAAFLGSDRNIQGEWFSKTRNLASFTDSIKANVNSFISFLAKEMENPAQSFEQDVFDISTCFFKAAQKQGISHRSILVQLFKQVNNAINQNQFIDVFNIARKACSKMETTEFHDHAGPNRPGRAFEQIISDFKHDELSEKEIERFFSTFSNSLFTPKIAEYPKIIQSMGEFCLQQWLQDAFMVDFREAKTIQLMDMLRTIPDSEVITPILEKIGQSIHEDKRKNFVECLWRSSNPDALNFLLAHFTTYKQHMTDTLASIIDGKKKIAASFLSHALVNDGICDDRPGAAQFLIDASHALPATFGNLNGTLPLLREIILQSNIDCRPAEPVKISL